MNAPDAQNPYVEPPTPNHADAETLRTLNGDLVELSDEELKELQADLDAKLRERRAHRYAGQSVEFIAREAHRTGCVAVVRYDSSLPNNLRLDFVREDIPDFLRPSDIELPALLRIQV
jgi:hypothetical protein